MPREGEKEGGREALWEFGEQARSKMDGCHEDLGERENDE